MTSSSGSSYSSSKFRIPHSAFRNWMWEATLSATVTFPDAPISRP